MEVGDRVAPGAATESNAWSTTPWMGEIELRLEHDSKDGIGRARLELAVEQSNCRG